MTHPMLIASQMAMGDTMDQMRAETDGLLLVNQWMVDAIVQLRAGQVHNRDNPIVIDDESSSGEETIAEVPNVPEQFHLVLIEDVVEDSEEDSEEEIWEISREEFEDEVVDARAESPEV